MNMLKWLRRLLGGRDDRYVRNIVLFRYGAFRRYSRDEVMRLK